PRHTHRLRETAPVLFVRPSAPDGKKRRRGELVHSRGGNTLTYKPSSLSNLQVRTWDPDAYVKSYSFGSLLGPLEQNMYHSLGLCIRASCLRAPKETLQDMGTQAKETITEYYEQSRERPPQGYSWREALACCLVCSGVDKPIRPGPVISSLGPSAAQ